MRSEPHPAPPPGNIPDITASGHAQPRDPELGRRRELAELLAGARDLSGDYDSTIALARHLQDRRRQAGQPAIVDQVLADLEATLRASTPLIDGLPRLHGTQLTAALATARRDYNRRIAEHLTYARTGLQGGQEP
jgi:hypothetical protein